MSKQTKLLLLTDAITHTPQWMPHTSTEWQEHRGILGARSMSLLLICIFKTSSALSLFTVNVKKLMDAFIQKNQVDNGILNIQYAQQNPLLITLRAPAHGKQLLHLLSIFLSTLYYLKQIGSCPHCKKNNKKTLKLSKTLSLWSEKREQVWILGRIKCSWNFNPNSTDVFFSTKRQFLCQNPKSINFKDCPRWNKHHKENERASTGKTTVCVCACVHVCTCVCVVCVIDRRVWPKAQYDLTACLISQRSQFYTSLGSG